MNDKTEPVYEQKTPDLTPEVLVPRLGEYLIECGLITGTQLTRAIELQKNAQKNGKSELIGQILVDEKMITRVELDRAVTEQILQLRSACRMPMPALNCG